MNDNQNPHAVNASDFIIEVARIQIMYATVNPPLICRSNQHI